MNADDLEAQILKQARDGYEVSRSEEDAALSAFERRLAMAPLLGLPGLVLPPIPDPATVAAAAGKVAATSTAAQASTTSLGVQTGAVQAGSGAVQAGAVQATTVAAAGSKVAAAAVSVGGAAAGGSAAAVTTATGIGTALLHLAPIKIVALTAALGGAAGATYQAVNAPQEIAKVETGESRPKPALSPASAPAAQERLRSQGSSVDVPPPPGEELEEELSIETVEAAITLEDLNEAPSRPPAPKKPASKVSSFQEELAALREVQGAIKNGNGSRALQLMSALDRDLPTGALMPERRMTKVLALCSVGRNREARHLARTVLDSSSGPMYSARIEKSCAHIEVGQGSPVDNSETALPTTTKVQQISPSPHTKK